MAASGLGIGIGFTIAKILSPVVSAGIGALAGLFFVLFFDDTYLAITTQLGWGLPAWHCLLYTSPSPRDQRGSRMPSSA